jgi:hypothetical protein
VTAEIDVGGADCGEIGAASTEPVDKAAQQTRRGPGRDGRAHALSPRGQGGRDDSRAWPSKVSRAGDRRAQSVRGRARRRATTAAERCEREPGRPAGPVRRERWAAKKEGQMKGRVRAATSARAGKPGRQQGDLRDGPGIGWRPGGRGRRGGVDPTGEGAEQARNDLEPRRRGAREE